MIEAIRGVVNDRFVEAQRLVEVRVSKEHAALRLKACELRDSSFQTIELMRAHRGGEVSKRSLRAGVVQLFRLKILLPIYRFVTTDSVVDRPEFVGSGQAVKSVSELFLPENLIQGLSCRAKEVPGNSLTKLEDASSKLRR